MEWRVTFVVRMTVDDAGQATAVIELVRTGRKEAIPDISALGGVVAGMLGPGVAGGGPPRQDTPFEASKPAASREAQPRGSAWAAPERTQT
jgi:hypothetical protein